MVLFHYLLHDSLLSTSSLMLTAAVTHLGEGFAFSEINILMYLAICPTCWSADERVRARMTLLTMACSEVIKITSEIKSLAARKEGGKKVRQINLRVFLCLEK